jgi:peptidyl-prolyl cis-trans isomerase SurA
LDAAVLTGLNVDQLGPEGKSMVMATETGERTDIFAQSGTLAVMYVCDRQDNVDALPDRDQIEDRLYSEQLGMVSERALRNLRREATIIRR